MSIPDPVAEIRELLIADANVASLAGTRVYGGGLADSARVGMPQATVVLKPAGGPGRRGYQKWRVTRIDTLCYAATLEESEQLHRYVRDVMENMNRPSPTLFSAEVSSDGANAIDPVEQWPVCFASYLVTSAIDP
jgi:hypothetical protein